MSEAQQQPQPNEPGARTPTGELKDQSQTTQPSQTPTDTKPTDQPSPTDKKVDDTTSLLNADDKKPDDKKPDAEKKPGDKKEEANKWLGAPEKYELKPPEGYEFDEKSIEEVAPIFKEMNLSQEAAQRLIDFHSKKMIEAAEAPFNTYKEMRAEWRKEIENDPDIGGTKFSQAKADIAKAYEAISTLDPDKGPKLVSEFKQAMNTTGAGDHPAFIRLFHKFASLVNEGKYVKGGGPNPGAVPQGQRRTGPQALYPNNPSSQS